VAAIFKRSRPGNLKENTLTLPRFVFVSVVICAVCTVLFAAPAAPPRITIAVDATQAPRKIFFAQLTIPASPGTLTLYYPKWIPGEHSPSGPVLDSAGLRFTGNGQMLKWRRSLDDGWTINVEVPAGVNEVHASLDFVSETESDQGAYSSGQSATEKLALISWNQLLLYPKGWTADQIMFTPSLRVPPGWKFATPLALASQSGDDAHFNPVSLYTLVDSPVLTGEFLKVVPLNQGQTPPVELDVAADSAFALDAPSEVWDHYSSVVKQATTLFGATHYRDYHFLYSLSDHVAHFGLEHHEANDSREDERTLVDPELRVLHASLLTHEYVHSWNGKYRRPADLTTPDYQQNMQTDLLWVYEGLTEYLGDVLAAPLTSLLNFTTLPINGNPGAVTWISTRKANLTGCGRTRLFASNRRERSPLTTSAICSTVRRPHPQWSRPTPSMT
jgi:predicted metalloprotease with PDZ domain